MPRDESLRWLCGGYLRSTLLLPLAIWIAPWWAGRSATIRSFMMNHTYGWMGGWMGGGIWIWTVIAVLVVVLLVVLINRLSTK